METLNMLYPAGILRNTSTGRFHPIVFHISPRPSDDARKDVMVRFRSSANHTTGFADLNDAQQFIADQDQWHDTGLQWD